MESKLTETKPKEVGSKIGMKDGDTYDQLQNHNI